MALLLFLLSKSPDGHAIYLQNVRMLEMRNFDFLGTKISSMNTYPWCSATGESSAIS